MAIVISIIALGVSIAAFVQSRQMGLLVQRREAINHARAAFTDLIEGHLTTGTSSSLREAFQISKLVFNADLTADVEDLANRAYMLDHKKHDEKTTKDWDEQAAIRDDLQKLLERMQAEASLGRWWPFGQGKKKPRSNAGL